MVHCMLDTRSRLPALMLMHASNVCRVTMCFGLGVGIGPVSRCLVQVNALHEAMKLTSKCSAKSTASQKQELQKFVDPFYMAQYYTNEGRLAAKGVGFSVDWRREFTTVMPTFQKFIEWQYKNLKEKGYVTRGTHPVVWCPKDKSPTGDHDRQSGEGVTPEEYTLIKYKLDEKTVLPAATFRPETIYGITNMWINPDATYVEASVNGENWIISQEAAEKLKEQERKVEVKRSFKGKELIGKSFENPVTKLKFPILPGWFVDPKTATGVVYSVPAHAPYD